MESGAVKWEWAAKLQGKDAVGLGQGNPGQRIPNKSFGMTTLITGAATAACGAVAMAGTGWFLAMALRQA